MTKEIFARNGSWILEVIRDKCELTQAETDYLDFLIEVLEQEPCEDCISRAEALEKINSTVLCTTNEARIIIKNLPSIQPKPKTGWIPVSERLPENHDDVLVWFEYIKDDYDCAWWGLAYYSLQYKKWIVSTNDRNPIVKAWMPLPEPYKAEKEENNG